MINLFAVSHSALIHMHLRILSPAVLNRQLGSELWAQSMQVSMFVMVPKERVLYDLGKEAQIDMEEEITGGQKIVIHQASSSSPMCFYLLKSSSAVLSCRV